MNTIDDRISAALRARAEALTEAELSPAAPPVGRRSWAQPVGTEAELSPAARLVGRRSWAQPARTRWTAPLLAAAIVGIVAAATVTAVQLSRSDNASPVTPPMMSGQPTPSAVAPTPSASSPAPSKSGSQPAPSKSQSHSRPQSSSSHSRSQSPSSQSGSQPSQSGSQPPTSTPPGPFEMVYQPLWPFRSYEEAEQWRTQGGGSQPWHLDAGQTALNFTRSYLRFTEIDQVRTPTLSDAGAHVGVGYLDPNGQLQIAAVLHLVRYGNAEDSPWEVVGSDDTDFTIEQPAYGSQVGSPITVGGHITGVDENVAVSVLASETDRVTLARVPAGGDGAEWTTGPVPFEQRGVLTIVASTGGHVQEVERFAIQGVHT